MNRYLIIIILLFIILTVGFGVAFLWYQNTNAPSPVGTGQTPPSTLPSVPQTNAPSDQAVDSTFMTSIASYNKDNVKVNKTIVVGDYALLDWSGDITGGEALLKYSQGQWGVASITGGAFSVAGLHEEGVPQKIVLALLNGLLKLGH